MNTNKTNNLSTTEKYYEIIKTYPAKEISLYNTFIKPFIKILAVPIIIIFFIMIIFSLLPSVKEKNNDTNINTAKIDLESTQKLTKNNRKKEFVNQKSNDNNFHTDKDNAKNNVIRGIITAKSGLFVRKEPNTKSQKLGDGFAYNTEVTILDTNGPRQTIENITSNWYKVTNGELTGWCFGGFISIIY